MLSRHRSASSASTAAKNNDRSQGWTQSAPSGGRLSRALMGTATTTGFVAAPIMARGDSLSAIRDISIVTSIRRCVLTVLLSVEAVSLTTSCQHVFNGPAPSPPPPVLATGALVPSPRLIVGRIVAVDEAQRLAFVELTSDAPSAALIAGTQLAARTLSLHDTGKIEVSPYIRGRTLGTKIVAGQPSPGDEVVWLAP